MGPFLTFPLFPLLISRTRVRYVYFFFQSLSSPLLFPSIALPWSRSLSNSAIYLHLSFSRLEKLSLRAIRITLLPSPSPCAVDHRAITIFHPSVLFSRRKKKKKQISLFLFVLSLMLRECGNPLVR